MNVNFAPKKSVGFFPESIQGPTPTKSSPSFVNTDPIMDQQDYAKNMILQGSDTSPARGGIAEGIARLGEALAGGYFKHQADQRLKDANAQNKQGILDALKSGNWEDLFSSDDPVAQRLGGAILSQQLKKGNAGSILSPEQAQVLGFEPGSVVQRDDEGFKVLQRPQQSKRPMTAGGMISYDEGKTWQPIEGYIDNARSVSSARRAPPTSKPDDSGVPPWERKW